MAAQLGLEEIRAAALNNVGSHEARRAIQREDLDEIAEAIDVARAANCSFEQCRAMGNLAALYWVRAAASARPGSSGSTRARRPSGTARRVSPAGSADSSDKDVRVRAVGRREERADAFIARSRGGIAALSGRPESMSSGRCSELGRGDADGVGDVRHAESSSPAPRGGSADRLSEPRDGGECAAHVFWEVGQSDRALPFAAEFVAAIQAGASSAT